MRRFHFVLFLSLFPIFSVAGFACTAGAAGAVTICAPADGATVASPVTFDAAASAPAGQTISAMKIYVDGSGLDAVTGANLTASETLSSGTHAVTIKAWTNTGTVLASRETIMVSTASSGGGCAATASAVTICSPAAGVTVSSPVSFNAVAGAPSGQTISAMKLYIDSVGVTTSSGASLSTSQTVAEGSHAVTVKAWTNAGTVFEAREMITVASTSSAGGCAATASAVTICSPAAGAMVSSPVSFSAVAGAPTGETVSAMKLYIDSVGVTTSNGASLSTSQTLAAGSHAVTVKAWTNAGTVLATKETITVGTATTAGTGGDGVLTYMYNNSRTGANLNETQLTPVAVTNGANFGLKGSWTLDGNTHTQPLYVPGVQMASGTYNVIYIATENDSLYALNADVPGQVLWKRSFLTSTATVGTAYTGGRTSIGANVGITGTPVIDADTQRLYLVARTTENSQQVERLHAIDIRTGEDVLPNTVISATIAGTGMGSDVNGNEAFDADTANQRPALALNNGVIYIAFAAFSDYDPYHGWLFAYSANDLSQLAVYNNTPNSGGGGIWMSGAGPAVDDDGDIYTTGGNVRPNSTGLWDPPTDLPNSLTKVKLDGSQFSLVDYFSPYDVQCLSAKDLDLGSSGPVLIPGTYGGHELLAFGSKEGIVYLLDRDSLGKFNSGSDSQIVDYDLFNPSGSCTSSTFQPGYSWRVYGTPAYWNGNIYFGSAYGPLRQYNITSGKLQQVALGTHTYEADGQIGRGPLTIVSANGTSNAIVWTAENDLNGDAWLRAYDATDVSKQLYVTNYGRGNSFMIPMVANGKVFVSGQSVLYVYGLLQ